MHHGVCSSGLWCVQQMVVRHAPNFVAKVTSEHTIHQLVDQKLSLAPLAPGPVNAGIARYGMCKNVSLLKRSLLAQLALPPAGP